MKLLKYLLIFIINAVSSIVIADLEYVNDDHKYDYNYGTSNGCRQTYDPYEKLNRKIFAFNSTLDYLILRPIAIGYKKATPDYAKARVNSFLSNIDTPLSVVNYGLQLNYNAAITTTWRFLINSTFGVLGLFDVATKVGIKPTRQTFGNTLAHYGVGPGPYLVLPLIGSTNARDVSDSVFTNYMLNPLMWYIHKDFKIITLVMNKINDRYTVLPFSDYIMENSPDPYISMRTALHQNRENSVTYPINFKCSHQTIK